MSIEMKCVPIRVLAVLAAAASTGTAQNLVDLRWAPASQTVDVGDVVELQLVATSDGATAQPFGALEALLDWDPAVLGLLGRDDAGNGYTWFVSDFLPDPDGINLDLADGDALYTALASPAVPAFAPPAPGLVVTTMRFTALGASPATSVRFTPALGAFGRTRVLDFFNPGVELTGDVSAVATVEVIGPSSMGPLCFGDGSGAACGCGNDGAAGEGCANSLGAGALLTASGTPSLSNDSLVLSVTQTTDQPGVIFQGDVALANPPVFGDGIRCCGMNVVRIGTYAPTANATDTATGTLIGGLGGPIAAHPENAGLTPGDSRCYQWWYRDPPGPCAGGFNLSNAYLVTWGP